MGYTIFYNYYDEQGKTGFQARPKIAELIHEIVFI